MLYFSTGNHQNNCEESRVARRMCVDTKQVVTSPLLWADMGEVEHMEEVFFLRQFGGAVHLLGRVRGS